MLMTGRQTWEQTLDKSQNKTKTTENKNQQIYNYPTNPVKKYENEITETDGSAFTEKKKKRNRSLFFNLFILPSTKASLGYFVNRL